MLEALHDLTPEARLSLLALSTRARRTARRDQLADLATQVEPERLSALFEHQRIATVGIARMNELGYTEFAEGLTSRLAPTLERARSMANVQSVLTEEVVDELERCSVPAVPLKGIVLAKRLYDDPAGRESHDIDVLVRSDQLDEAVSIVTERFGYAAPVDAVDRNGRPLLHYSLSHARAFPSIELHWRVHWYEERSGAAMVERSSLTGGVRRLRDVDELACLLLFYARDAFIGLRNLVAVAAWWDRFGEELPADGLASFMAEFPELRHALTTSVTTAEMLTGVPRARLGVAPSSLGPRQRGAVRMANVESDRARVELEADVALVDLLLSPRTEMKTFVRRQKLLNASFVAVRGGAPDSRLDRLFVGPRMLRRGTRLLRAFARSVLAGAANGPRGGHAHEWRDIRRA